MTSKPLESANERVVRGSRSKFRGLLWDVQKIDIAEYLGAIDKLGVGIPATGKIY